MTNRLLGLLAAILTFVAIMTILGFARAPVHVVLILLALAISSAAGIATSKRLNARDHSNATP